MGYKIWLSGLLLFVLLTSFAQAHAGHNGQSAETVIVRAIGYDEVTDGYTFECNIPSDADPMRHWAIREDGQPTELDFYSTSPTLGYTFSEDSMYHVGCEVLNTSSGEYLRGDFHIDRRTGPNTDIPEITILSTDALVTEMECTYTDPDSDWEMYDIEWTMVNGDSILPLPSAAGKSRINYTAPNAGLWDFDCKYKMKNKVTYAEKYPSWGYPIELFSTGPAYIPNFYGCVPGEACPWAPGNFYNIPANLTVPTLTANYTNVTAGHKLNLNWTDFDIELVTSTHVHGEGHIHWYINDVKQTKFFSNMKTFPHRMPGTHNITVRLATNDHREYAVANVPIQSSVFITMPPLYDVEAPEPIPTIDLTVTPFTGGANLTITTTNITLINTTNMTRVPGQGHIHWYLNGVKQGRIYTNTHTVTGLPNGQHDIAVRFATNNHQEYAISGSPIEDNETINISGSSVNTPPVMNGWIEPSFNRTDVDPFDLHMHIFPMTDAEGDNHISSDFEVWTVSPNERVWHATDATILEHIHLGDGLFENSHAGQSRLNYDESYYVRARVTTDSLFNHTSNWSYVPFSTITQPIFNQSPFLWTARPGYTVRKVASDISMAVNIDFAPDLYTHLPVDDRPLLYVTQLYGQIGMITTNGTYVQYADNLLNYASFGSLPGSGEAGVVGIYVDETTGDLFVSFVYKDASDNLRGKVDRFYTNTDGDNYTSRTTLLTDIPISASHQVHTINRGPDGKLYLHIGDGDNITATTDPTRFEGKIIRFNEDGSIPVDNPIPGSYMYAGGLRNPFGGDFHPQTGTLYVSNNGPDEDDGIYQVTPGDVYGWCCNTSFDTWNLYEDTVAPTAIAFDPGTPGFPNSTYGDMYLAQSGPTYSQGPAVHGKRITHITFNPDYTIANEEDFVVYTSALGWGAPIGLHFGPDGLYFTDIYGEAGFVGLGVTKGNIYKIVPGNQSNDSQTGTQFQAGIGPAPWFPQGTHVVWVCVGLYGSGNYNYDFYFGDGTEQLGVSIDNTYHIYPGDGTYNVSCTVNDLTTGNSETAHTSICIGNCTIPPPPTNVTNGTLSLASSPTPLPMFIDGVPYGNTPNSVSLIPGTYNVSVFDGVKSNSSTVVITDSATSNIFLSITYPPAATPQPSGEPVVVREVSHNTTSGVYTFNCTLPANAGPTRTWTVHDNDGVVSTEVTNALNEYTFTLPDEKYNHISCGALNSSGAWVMSDFHIDTRSGLYTDRTNVEIISTDALDVTAKCTHPTDGGFTQTWSLFHPQTGIYYDMSAYDGMQQISFSVTDPSLWDIGCGGLAHGAWSYQGVPVEFFPAGEAYVANLHGCLPWEDPLVCMMQGNGTPGNSTPGNSTNATINVSSLPSGVSLSLNGIGYGVTPNEVSVLPGGYTVFITNGTSSNSTLVSVGPGDYVNVFLTLLAPPVNNVTCYNDVQSMPVTCSGGTISSDTYTWCRFISCDDGVNYLDVMACNKPGDYMPTHFEMYKTAETGSGVEICLGPTCISNSGFATATFPACFAGNNTPICTDADLDGYAVEGGVCGLIDCNDADSDINPGESEVCNGIDDNCAGGIDEGGVCPSAVCGNSIIESPETCDDGNTIPGDGCDASCQIESSASVTLEIAPWFPQGMSYVFHCTPSGMTPTSYDFDFGDGNSNNGRSTLDVYYTYGAPGNYTVTCTAHEGATSVQDTLAVTVI